MKKPTNGSKHSPKAGAPLRARASQPDGARSPSAALGIRPVLITGGAGFIGTNLAKHFLRAGQPVLLLDNLSRPGVEKNVTWLRQTFGDLVQVQVSNIQDYDEVSLAVAQAACVFHFAAQVAVTTSLSSPFQDFDVNARGTLNLLEAARALSHPPPIVFTSTNKVYGQLSDVALQTGDSRYEPKDDALRCFGFDERRALDFHSPYGCSKGAAEQYVLDYARTFRLPAVVFRMSCIYGPHQFGTEDQGWVAHFLIRALEDRPITVYGDGRQVRDILFVDDLVQALVLAYQKMASLSGNAFNLGGGPSHTVSLLELIDIIAELQGKPPVVRFDEWRPADQQYYVSDTRKFAQAAGWKAKVGVRRGIKALYSWLQQAAKTLPIPLVLPPPPAQNVPAITGHLRKVLHARAAGPDIRSTSDPRSKRLWTYVDQGDRGGKIIKFP